MNPNKITIKSAESLLTIIIKTSDSREQHERVWTPWQYQHWHPGIQQMNQSTQTTYHWLYLVRDEMRITQQLTVGSLIGMLDVAAVGNQRSNVRFKQYTDSARGAGCQE